MSKQRVDALTINANDLGDVVGEACGIPVIAWDPKLSQAREDADALNRVLFARAWEAAHVEEANVPVQN